MPSKPHRKDCPAALRHHDIMLKTFLSRNKQYTNLTVGSFIFFPPKAAVIPSPPSSFALKRSMSLPWYPPDIYSPPRLLLLQRADPKRMFLDLWELPGGGSELTNWKILDIVANKTFEQTGLHLKKFVQQIGNGVEYKNSDGPGVMLCFEIEIKEVTDEGRVEKYDSLGELAIELDRKKHHEFVWATEQEIIDEIFPAESPERKAVMLQAFEQRRQDIEVMKALEVETSEVQKHTKHEDSHEDDDEEDGFEEEYSEHEDSENEDSENEDSEDEDGDKEDDAQEDKNKSVERTRLRKSQRQAQQDHKGV